MTSRHTEPPRGPVAFRVKVQVKVGGQGRVRAAGVAWRSAPGVALPGSFEREPLSRTKVRGADAVQGDRVESSRICTPCPLARFLLTDLARRAHRELSRGDDRSRFP